MTCINPTSFVNDASNPVANPGGGPGGLASPPRNA